jgi:hypothetical protein
MLQEEKIDREQLEDFLKFLEEEDEKNDLHFRQLTA